MSYDDERLISLNGMKIQQFISQNLLSPAKVVSVDVSEAEEKSSYVVAPVKRRIRKRQTTTNGIGHGMATG